MLRAIYISYDGILGPLGQSQILPYVRELSAEKNKFYLVSFEKKEYYNKASYDNCFNDLMRHNIKWFVLFYHKKPQILSTIFDIFNGFIFSLFIILRYRPKIIHARSYVPALIAWFLKKIFRIKFIFDMRGFWVDERIEGRIWKRKKGILYKFVKFIEDFLLKDADEIIVLTRPAKAILKDWGYRTDNVSVIPCCVDEEYFKFSENSRVLLRNKYNLSGKFIFVHAGSLGHWYMKDKMLDYFKCAAGIIPNAHFLILTHDDRNKITELIMDNKLSPECFTILNVSFKQMPEYLSMADAGIFFITPVFSKLASSPTKFAEYLSCGFPIIINDRIGDLEEYVSKDNVGVIVRNFSRQEYRRTFMELLALLRNEDLKARCRAAACSNFSLKLGVDKYNRIYQRRSTKEVI